MCPVPPAVTVAEGGQRLHGQPVALLAPAQTTLRSFWLDGTANLTSDYTSAMTFSDEAAHENAQRH
jgi:hypothetical protein